MASSSVSQDDIDNDFEKNSRRSRIRTARARQINPSGCRLESNQNQNNQTGPGGDHPGDLDLVGHGHHHDHQELNNAQGGVGGLGASGSSASAASNTINKYDKLVAVSDEAADHEIWL